MPTRFQRTRAQSWADRYKDVVYVGRPSRYRNPYRLGKDGSRAEVIRKFEDDLRAGKLDVTIEDVKRELKGLNLECWCPRDLACHADVLIRVANYEGVYISSASVVE